MLRVSTSLLFNSGTLNLQRNQSALFKTQNQLSTGRRMLAPEDDPVAAAQALVTEQSKAMNEQFIENQGSARSQLGLVENHLGSLGDLLQSVRERTIQLGNPALSDRERSSIADELRQRFDEVVGIANSQNGLGEYLFSGFQGATRPFSVQSPLGAAPFAAGSAVATPNPSVVYSGDDGERRLQVDSARQMAISVSGADVFMRNKQGNGTFATSASAAVTGVTNTGTGKIDDGSVTDVSKWNASLIQPQDFKIAFQLDATSVPSVLKYNLLDAATGNSLFTNAAPGAVTAADWKVFTSGQAIPFTGLDPTVVPGGDLGIQVTVSGVPANGDQFEVTASQNQSIFDTLQNLISYASTPVPATAAGNSQLSNQIAESLSALDRSLDNVLQVRSGVGASLAELDTLSNTASAKNVQYEDRLSGLQDLDYASAIAELNKQQLQLQAAQQSFVKVSGLSLFNFLG